MTRPSFIVAAADVAEDSHVYPKSDERMGATRRIGKAAGLTRLGINIQRLAPGQRSSWPHAEEDEEEFAYVIEGEVEAWTDGVLHKMRAGDLIAWPAGTGICHAILNNSERDALLIVGGEAPREGSRIYYPLHPSRRDDIPAKYWWDDVPKGPQGPHDGLPDKQRKG